MSRRSHENGFTLVELLVVVGIITVLIALMMPMFRVARERANRIRCANRLHQLNVAVLAYSTTNNDRLPTGTRGDNEEHTVWLPTDTLNVLMQTLGKQDLTMFACPNLQEQMPFGPYQFGNSTAWVIGYAYQGGHPILMREYGWKSPLTTHDSPTAAVWSDVNDYATIDDWTMISHGHGYSGTFTYAFHGATPQSVGGEGGHVTYLDGSVLWHELSQMTDHYISSPSTQYHGEW